MDTSEPATNLQSAVLTCSEGPPAPSQQLDPPRDTASKVPPSVGPNRGDQVPPGMKKNRPTPPPPSKNDADGETKWHGIRTASDPNRSRLKRAAIYDVGEQGDVYRRFIAVMKIPHQEAEVTGSRQADVGEETSPPGAIEDGRLAERSGTEGWEAPARKRPCLRGSPSPPISIENPAHGDSILRVIQLPPPPFQVLGRVPPAGLRGYSLVTSGIHGFENAEHTMMGMTQKHSPPQQRHQIQSPPATQPQPRPWEPVISKDLSPTPSLYEVGAAPRAMAVALPEEANEGDHLLEIMDPSGLSVFPKPDDECLHELFPRDIGSKPIVKIPHPTPKIFPDNPNRRIPAAPRAMLRDGKWQFQTKKIFKAFSAKNFANGRGRFLPVRLPGGTAIEVPNRGVGRGVGPGPRRGYPQQRYRNNYYRHAFRNTHNGGNPGHMGHSRNS